MYLHIGTNGSGFNFVSSSGAVEKSNNDSFGFITDAMTAEKNIKK